MKKASTLTNSFLALSLALCSCASSYRPIGPEVVHYDQSELSSSAALSTSYTYDVMSLRNNKKYAKKEDKRSIRVVAVRVVNNTSTTINIGKDCRLLMDSRQVIPMDASIAANKIKQGVPIYLLYSLLFLNITNESSSANYQESSSASIPVGIPTAATNMLIASTANMRMKQELVSKNIMNKTVAPGETVYGLVCLNVSMTGPLKFELNQLN